MKLAKTNRQKFLFIFSMMPILWMDIKWLSIFNNETSMESFYRDEIDELFYCCFYITNKNIDGFIKYKAFLPTCSIILNHTQYDDDTINGYKLVVVNWLFHCGRVRIARWENTWMSRVMCCRMTCILWPVLCNPLFVSCFMYPES